MKPALRSMRIAAIDIGTNTFRILICDRKNDGLEKLHIERIITRLGGGFTEQEKEITKDAMDRAIDALSIFSKLLDQYKVDKIRAVATGVVREAVNGDSFVEKVKKSTSIRIEKITGEEEAMLTARGVVRSVSLEPGCVVIFDVGGGSTEYVLLRNKEILNVVSTNLGVVRLAEKYDFHEILSLSELDEVAKGIRSTLRLTLQSISKKSVYPALAATAGTPTTLAAMELGLEHYDSELVNGSLLERAMIRSTLYRLAQMPSHERRGLNGLESGREDVIIPGALIMLETMDYFSRDKVTVSDGGLLEGVAYSLIYM